MGQLFTGTSGFAYPSWKPDFYPPKLPAKNFLAHYAQRLNSVEINYTFRTLPAASTLNNWIEATPPGFIFALKASQRVTHFLRLKNADEAMEMFFAAVEPLRAAQRLGPILFQLPPNFQCDLEVLSAFLDLLPPHHRYAFEFRHESWFCDSLYQLLKTHRIALCLAESEKLQVPHVITSDFVYCRLRKTDYTPEDRRAIAAKVQKLIADERDVFVYFKHEETPAGALYAAELLQEARA